jgi:DNA-binding NarL/FixJ family response regulator
MLNLEQQNLKKLDFNKSEYEYFIENCNFTDRQKEILDLRRKGKSIIEISFITNYSERTINREIKTIKHKIYKII